MPSGSAGTVWSGVLCGMGAGRLRCPGVLPSGERAFMRSRGTGGLPLAVIACLLDEPLADQHACDGADVVRRGDGGQDDHLPAEVVPLERGDRLHGDDQGSQVGERVECPGELGAVPRLRLREQDVEDVLHEHRERRVERDQHQPIPRVRQSATAASHHRSPMMFCTLLLACTSTWSTGHPLKNRGKGRKKRDYLRKGVVTACYAKKRAIFEAMHA